MKITIQQLEDLIKQKVNEAGIPNKMLTGALYAPFPGFGALSGGIGLTYKQLFHKEDEGLSNDGFDSFEKWFEAVHSNKADSRLKTLEEGSDPGYLVPPEFRVALWDLGLEDSISASRRIINPKLFKSFNHD